MSCGDRVGQDVRALRATSRSRSPKLREFGIEFAFAIREICREHSDEANVLIARAAALYARHPFAAETALAALRPSCSLVPALYRAPDTG